jgi:DNA repair exonuclease SbcCD nuclease subunit
MSLFGFFSQIKTVKTIGYHSNIQFQNFNPESKVLFLYNMEKRSQYDLKVILKDIDGNVFHISVDKISVRCSFEINIDNLIDQKSNKMISQLSSISVLSNDQQENFRLNDDGKILRIR